MSTFDAASRVGEGGNAGQANFLVEQGRSAFAHAFGSTMLLAMGVIVVNAVIVWTLQGRHRSAEAPGPLITPTAPHFSEPDPTTTEVPQASPDIV